MYRLPALTRLRRRLPIIVENSNAGVSHSVKDLPETPFLDLWGKFEWDALENRPSVATVQRYCLSTGHRAALLASAGPHLTIIEGLVDSPTRGQSDLDRAELMLDMAGHSFALAQRDAEPRALEMIQLNWLGFAIATNKLPQACLALYQLLLSWRVSEQAAVAILEPGVCYLDDLVDDTGEPSLLLRGWVQSSKDDPASARHVQSVIAGLECVSRISANLLVHGDIHDSALIHDFVYRARRWSRLGDNALADADLAQRWPSHAQLAERLDQLECWVLSTPASPSCGFFGIPVSGRLPTVRVHERLGNQFAGAVSPFFTGDRFSFKAYLDAAGVPLEQFLGSDGELLRTVMDAGGVKADFHGLAEAYHDQIDGRKAKDAESDWDETQSILFLRALSCRALAVVLRQSWESANDLNLVLARYAQSEEQDTGFSKDTPLLLFAPLASVIDEALRVTVDGETIQLGVWVAAFRSALSEEQIIARSYLQQLRFAWISLCRLLSDGRSALLALAGAEGLAELALWVEDRVEDLLALGNHPDMSFLLGEERDDRGQQLNQAKRRFRVAATNAPDAKELPQPSGRVTRPSRLDEDAQAKQSSLSTTSDETPLIQVVDARIMDSYADSKSIKEYWSLKKAERLKAGLTLLPASLESIRTLRQEFPWFHNVIDFLELWITRNAALGIVDCKLPPILLLGGYGCGKTYFGRRLAEILNLPFRLLPAGGSSDNRQLMGTSRGWGTAFPSLPVDFMAETGIANGYIVVDEIDKESTDRRNGRMSDTLLQLLEPANAKSFMDLFLGCPVDCRHLQWLLTANSLAGINRALLSRVRLFSVEQPSRDHYPRLAEQIRLGFARDHKIDHRFLPRFDGDDLDLIRKNCRSVREVRQATEWLLTQKIVAERGRAVVN